MDQFNTSCQLHFPFIWSPAKSPFNPLHRKLSDPQGWTGRFGEEGKFLLLSRTEAQFLRLLAPASVATPLRSFARCHTYVPLSNGTPSAVLFFVVKLLIVITVHMTSTFEI